MKALFGAELVEHADKIADAAHGATGKLYGSRPYIVHPREVADLARALGYSEEVIAGCLLHDTIEDTGLTAEDLLAERMPLSVVRGVVAVTWTGNGTTAEKMAQAKSNPMGHVIKFCDASRNFATTVNPPYNLGIEATQGKSGRYAEYLGELILDRPTPGEVVLYCQSVDNPSAEV